MIVGIIILSVTWYLLTLDNDQELEELGINDYYDFGTIDTNPTELTIISGCTDPAAINYEATATFQGQSQCYYHQGCCDINSPNYDPMADTCDLPNNDDIYCNFENANLSINYPVGHPLYVASTIVSTNEGADVYEDGGQTYVSLY